MKIIKVDTCQVCPYRCSHNEKEGVLRVPFCNHTGDDLPYGIAKKSQVPTAAPSNVIPEWCPLSDNG